MVLIQETQNKKLVHFVMVPFTGLGLHKGFRGNKWLKNRIRIFNEYVLPSLTNQTKQEFIVWVSWREEEKNNPIVQDFVKKCEKIRGMRFVHTFGGLCFWDDKYDDEVASKRLLSALEKSLPNLEEYVLENTDIVLMTIQPSDDMYICRAVEFIQDWAKGFSPASAYSWTQGYIMNYATKEIAEYDPDTIPPFFTIKFPDRDIFLNPEKHYKYIGPYKSHEYIKDHLPTGFNVERGFCVGTHGENISTTFNHPYKGRILRKEEAEAMMIDFGILYSDPIVVKRGLRLISRLLLNYLPFQDKLRYWYHNYLPNSLKWL